MKLVKIIVALSYILSLNFSALSQIKLDDSLANRLAALPLKCIQQEYPNKTGHTIQSEADSRLTPRQLHPSFYGCFDWHSSVHGHWMLVKLLKEPVTLLKEAQIRVILEQSFQPQLIMEEASYFTQYELGKIFERTYGWAWLLKLDEELYSSQDPQLKKWHQALQPLTQQIVRLWKEYLPKQTYPNRTGVHPNSAFGLSFAIDWARTVGDQEFENMLIAKAKHFYLNDQNTPAHLEPDGADFFSPSLQIADLMTRILSDDEYILWLEQFYTTTAIERVCELPIVSDRMDYQITHLDGLMFSRAWNIKHILQKLPNNHPWIRPFTAAKNKFLSEALYHLDKGNYGGEHWLASFAIYALTN